MIDIGANLLHSQFDSDREAVIERAHTAGVARILLTATDVPTSTAAIEFCATRSDIRCTAGVHPHVAKDVQSGWTSLLSELAGSPFVKALGEMGLDYNRNFSTREQQQTVFHSQLEIAEQIGKPVFVHDREASADVLAALKNHSRLAGVVVHCFTGDASELDDYLSAGFHIGITGWVCDQRRGQPLRDIVTRVPLSKLLIETDAPYLLPHNAPADVLTTANKRRNEPALLKYVAQQLAELYGTEESEIVTVTSRNATELFDWAG
ncbi:MAG: TatD family hydrolase [Gammaproteobacteria bacterium]|nr:TatD family hydrolase [Gammaproteobacteria bacterium]